MGRQGLYRNLLVIFCCITMVSCSASTNEKIEGSANKSVEWIGRQFSSAGDWISKQYSELPNDDDQARMSEKSDVSVKVLKGQLEKIPPLEIIGTSYRTVKSANVRGGPGTDFVVVDNIRQDAVVMVIGKVQNKPWYLIGDGDVANGFVYQTLLEAVPETESKELTADKTGKDTGVVQEEEVEAERLCRTIQQKITTADGATREEAVTACQGPNGWKIQ